MKLLPTIVLSCTVVAGAATVRASDGTEAAENVETVQVPAQPTQVQVPAQPTQKKRLGWPTFRTRRTATAAESVSSTAEVDVSGIQTLRIEVAPLALPPAPAEASQPVTAADLQTFANGLHASVIRDVRAMQRPSFVRRAAWFTTKYVVLPTALFVAGAGVTGYSILKVNAHARQNNLPTINQHLDRADLSRLEQMRTIAAQAKKALFRPRKSKARR